VPQNRERVFLIGIRDDIDNDFQFPKEEYLSKRLKDVLEDGVDDKYFLSEAAINKCLKSQANENMLNEDIPDKSRCIVAGYYKQPFDGQYLKIKSGTAKGYEEAKEGDSINFSVPNSETRRGRVGKGVAQTLDTACNQGVMIGDYRTDEGFRWRQDGNSPAIMAMMRDTWKENFTGQNPPIINKDYKIRRLTPRECFRLMDFPDTFTWPVSDSQAYKQAGNSIVVNVLYKIIKNLSI